METRKLIELLRASTTVDPSIRQPAEEQLAQVHKIIGFAPALLQVVMSNDCENQIRQAGAIFLKNLVSSNWIEQESDQPGAVLEFAIHEQDKALIRDSIVDAIVLAPELIRLQLCTCINNIIKHDFPGRWTQIVDKISIYLSSPDGNGWHGAILCLYQLVKNYEYKKKEERGPLHEAMNLLLPLLYQLTVRLLPDPSECAVLLQKESLKVYFALTQYILPLDLITKEAFTQWMEICRQVADRPVPPQALQPDEDERPALPWWKCKKWALHILHRMFERYGSPSNVTKEFSEFAEWYLKTFSNGILEVLLRLLDSYRSGNYQPPRVLQQTLNYVNQAVSHSFTWNILKPHMCAIIQDILYPLMSYSNDDEELWTVDPHEYIRVKFDVFEDFVSPVTAAQTLLHSACKKRKGMLVKTMNFLTAALNDPNTEPRRRDGALHMVGSVADVILKKRLYREQLHNFFLKYIFPEFNSPRGHLRARACWVLHFFAEAPFHQEPVLAESVRLTTNALLHDQDLPVRVEAAIALQSLLNYQEKCHKYVEPQVKDIALELLKIIRDTENEDVTGVMQKLVCIFTFQLTPIAVEICQHLAATFSQVLDTDEGTDEKAITAMGLLNTIETLLTVMEEQPEVMRLLEPTVLQVVGHVLQNEVQEFYEEALSLIFDCTSKNISEDMWKVFELLYQVFMKSGLEYFTDMMPALHNYVTVDMDGFLANEQRLLAIYNMCKEVLTKDSGEDPECHAAKLLEVVLLQYRGRIDNAAPTIVELAAARLLREVRSSELRTMCLQVLIAGLYYSPVMLFSILEKLPDFTSLFIKQWLHDMDCFLGIHDRKICILGMCTLIALPQKPPILVEMAPKVMPSMVLLFEGLKRAYATRAQELAEEEEEESEGEDEDCEEALSSDEDEIDEDRQDYLEKLTKKAVNALTPAGFQVSAKLTTEPINDDSEDDDDDSYDANEDMVLENYTTPIDDDDYEVDEYMLFKEVMTRLETSETEWYGALTSALTDVQRQSLLDICVLAEQRRAARESKIIEQRGGYAFTEQTVPTSFHFGNASLGS